MRVSGYAIPPFTATLESFDTVERARGRRRHHRFDLKLSSPVRLGLQAMRDHAFDVTNGRIVKVRRIQKTQLSYYGGETGTFSDHWRLETRPTDADSAVTVALKGVACGLQGGMCAQDNGSVDNTPSLTIGEPITLSIADTSGNEDDGQLLFDITLSRASEDTVKVRYRTISGGTATERVDYWPHDIPDLVIPAGNATWTVGLVLRDDLVDDDGETVKVEISNAQLFSEYGDVVQSLGITGAEATGTINNSDPLPRALLARFGRAAAAHVVEQVEARIEAPRGTGFEGRFAGRELRRGMERDVALGFLSQLGGIAGGSVPGAGVHDPMSGSPLVGGAPHGTPGPAGGGARMAAAAGPLGAGPGLGATAGPMGGMAGRDGGLDGLGLLEMGFGGGDLLTGSEFALNRETRRGGIFSVWSRGARSQFAGSDGALALDGDVRTTMFGADYAKGPLVAGLSMSHSRGLGSYASVDAGRVASAVTGLYPWLGYKATDRITVWGVAGYGTGGLLLTPAAGPALESGLSMAMAAGGTRGELVAGGAGGFDLAFKADALWVATTIDGAAGPSGRMSATEAAATRFRTGLEGSRNLTLAGRVSLKPSVEVGLRHDGGDAEAGAGMDVGGGLVVFDPSTGLSVDVRVRMLVVHQAEGFRERGMALSFSYNPTSSTPLGFMARVAPSWGGEAARGAEALWGRETMAGMAHGGVASGNRLDGEVGYGLPVGSRFVGTPRVGFSTSEYGRDYRIGYGLGVLGRESLNIELGVDAHRRESPMLDGTDNGFLGRATLGW